MSDDRIWAMADRLAETFEGHPWDTPKIREITTTTALSSILNPFPVSFSDSDDVDRALSFWGISLLICNHWGL
jgi:hypothetical protein